MSINGSPFRSARRALVLKAELGGAEIAEINAEDAASRRTGLQVRKVGRRG